MKATIVARHTAVVALALLTGLASLVLGQKRITDLKPTLILISADGFRYDYIDKFDTPTLKSMAADGVRAKWMEPSFPTKTFPNHYTVATGLYPARNGIVDNNVWAFGTVFSMGNRNEVENPRWWLGEPIWVTAQKQGQIAASYFFVGSEAPIKGVRPTFWRSYNGGVPPQMRVDSVLGWLDLPTGKRPTMITMYFSDADDAGHEFGPESTENRYAVSNVDSYVKRLRDGLRARGIENKVNIIFVADHGMAPYKVTNVTFLDDYFDLKLAERVLWSNEMVHIFPKEGQEASIMMKIGNLKNVSCWKKSDVPARFHYSGGDRIAPIVCMSALGWVTTSHPRYDSWMATVPDPERTRGGHGYDPQLPEMRATFIANGPAFKKGYLAEPFSNVNVYNIMCDILGLKPAPNDGVFDSVKGMMAPKR